MTLFGELVRSGRLLGPQSRRPVVVAGDRVVEPASQRDLGPLRGPLNFLPEGAVPPGSPAAVEPADVARLREKLDLPFAPDIDAALAEAIAATTATLSEPHLSAEAQMLAERFRIPEFSVGKGEDSLLSRLAGSAGRMVARMLPGPPAAVLVSHSIGQRLTCGQEVWRSLRVRNSGRSVLLASAPGATAIEVGWLSDEQLAMPELSVLTSLPIDVEPGREITLIVRVRPPSTPGRFTLVARLVVEGEPVGAPFLSAPVQAIGVELPIFDYDFHPDLLEYGADHHVAFLEALAFVRERIPSGSALLLEIGGGVHPTGHAIAAEGHKVVSADISPSQSMLGELYFRHKRPDLSGRLGFMACDGCDLPFTDGAFDGVMLFAAFHHFPDPVRLLREARRVTKPSGFVIIGCETCAPNPFDPQYRDELRRGINEQMWTLAEFTEFFRVAGLRVARARIDGHSLKAALVKETAATPGSA